MSYLVSALIILWLLVGIYIVYMLMKQRSLEREIRLLEEEFKDRIDREDERHAT